MKKLSGALLGVVLFSLCVGNSFAEVNDCRAIFIDIKQWRLHKTAGACYGGINMANENAEKRCRQYAHDPHDCMSGQMSFKGDGYYNLSTCNANEYIAMSCTRKDDRPYCRIACGDKQEAADSKSIDDCMDIHYLDQKGCKLQALEY